MKRENPEQSTFTPKTHNDAHQSGVGKYYRSACYVWVADLFWQAIIVAFFIWLSGFYGSLHPNHALYPWLPVAAFFIVWPIAHSVQSQIYKANWVGNAVTPEGYLKAFWAKSLIHPWVVIAGIFSFALSGVTFTACLGIALGFTVQLMGYPSRLPMQPTSPRLGKTAQQDNEP